MKLIKILLLLIFLFGILFNHSDSYADDKILENFSITIEKNKDCDWDSIYVKKIEVEEFYYYLKNKKINKTFCDYVFLSYFSFLLDGNLTDRSFSFKNAKIALEIDLNRHSLPHIIFATSQFDGVSTTTKKGVSENIDKDKALFHLNKSIQISSKYYELVYSQIAFFYENFFDADHPERVIAIDKCLNSLIPKNTFLNNNFVLVLEGLLRDSSSDFKKNIIQDCAFQKAKLLLTEEPDLAVQIFTKLVEYDGFGYSYLAEAYCEGKYEQNIDVNLGKIYLEKGIDIGLNFAAETKYHYLQNGMCGYERNKLKARELIREYFVYFNDYRLGSLYAEDLFYGYGGRSDKIGAIKILENFAKDKNFRALTDLAYYLSYDEEEVLFDIDKAINYVNESIRIQNSIGLKPSYEKYLLARLYVQEFFHINKINTDDLNIYDIKTQKNYIYNYFEDIQRLNKKIYELFLQSCLENILYGCEDAALYKIYGAEGIKVDIDFAAFLYSKIWIENDFSSLDSYPRIVSDFPSFNKLVSDYVRDRKVYSNQRESWSLIFTAGNYRSKNIIDIPQASKDGEMMMSFFERNNYLTWWYEDVDMNFFNNLNQELELLINQGKLYFNNLNIKNNQRDLIFYYSGHAIAYKGKNYLLPVDIEDNFPSFSEARPYLINIDKLIKKLANYFNGTMIIILDACRTKSNLSNNKKTDNFLFKSIDSEFLFSSSSHDGLAPIDAGPNKLIVFASEAGKPALFKLSDKNSIFTDGLVEALNLYADEDIEEQILRARRIVSENTNGLQIPISYSSLINKYYVNNN
tara:strand:- start:2847 stop:5252 length:2406 start_codon:yes stop_codon:yes gene_type:complete